VQEPKQTEAPLEGQLESAEKEVMPAVNVYYMAALMAMMQSMQQNNATRLSALQPATDTEQAVCAAISICSDTAQQYMVYVATADADEQQAPTANSDCVHGSLSDLRGSTQIESAAPTTTSDREYTGAKPGDYLTQCDRALRYLELHDQTPSPEGSSSFWGFFHT
jgi:hypothetical protein